MELLPTNPFSSASSLTTAVAWARFTPLRHQLVTRAAGKLASISSTSATRRSASGLLAGSTAPSSVASLLALAYERLTNFRRGDIVSSFVAAACSSSTSRFSLTRKPSRARACCFCCSCCSCSSAALITSGGVVQRSVTRNRKASGLSAINRRSTSGSP